MIEEFQRKTIYDSISNSGWRISELERAELEWWASEIWLVESLWSPVGKTAFISFLYEPEFCTRGLDSNGVPERLAERSQPSSCSLNLRSGWQEDLPGFIECLSGLRA
jgi:hypothetical protein